MIEQVMSKRQQMDGFSGMNQEGPILLSPKQELNCLRKIGCDDVAELIMINNLCIRLIVHPF
jgi:hypothetical protein